jgi:hypothetical protein
MAAIFGEMRDDSKNEVARMSVPKADMSRENNVPESVR